MDREQSSYLNPPIPRPSWIRFFGEPFLVWKDIAQSLLFQQSYDAIPSGDGHPVLILPGFLGNDLSTLFLRRFIQNLGYSSYGWEMGTNLGDIRKLHGLLEKIEYLHQKHQSKVSLIGWSLGGVYGRQLAKRRPDLIRQIITMGAPFADIEQSNNAAWFYKVINQNRPVTEKEREWLVDIAAPAPLPTTAIYSKVDGIVPWQTCMEYPEDNWHQNIEVGGSHLGLPYTPAVWIVVEDRLKFGQKNWQPFQRKDIQNEWVCFPTT
ncbi:MAG: alpha/beta hydrolase [Bacteroidota bacterium]